MIIVNVGLIMMGSEIVLRALADKLPVMIIQLIPTSDRNKLLARRGLFTHDSIQGYKMLYSWKPSARPSAFPWISVDEHGYRNPADPPGTIDVVLLGDSVTIAQNSRIDMGEQFRKAGISAINLGFNGYGPFHERDVYQNIIIANKMPHKLVLINFCYCNDISDAKAYHDILSKGRDWKDYLGSTASRAAFPFSFEPPWVISILFNAPFEMVQSFRSYLASRSEVLTLDLPSGKISIEKKFLVSFAGNTTNGWMLAQMAIEDMARLSQAAGSQLILAYYPNLAQIYLPWIPENMREPIVREYQYATSKIQEIARQNNILYFDYTSAINPATSSTLVTLNSGDYHPNDEGVRVMANAILPLITKSLSARPAP